MNDTLATRIESFLAAAATQLVTLVGEVRAAIAAIDRNTASVDRLRETVAPVVGDAAARANFGVRAMQLVRQLKITNSIATGVLLLSLALSLPVFLSGIALALTDPHALITAVVHLVDSARGVDVHPSQTPKETP
jgi:hypothetical protein